MIRPRSSTTMAPTQGLGEVSPMPARARACASVMKRSSVDFEATTLFHHEGDEGSRREMCGAFAEGKPPRSARRRNLGHEDGCCRGIARIGKRPTSTRYASGTWGTTEYF